MSGKACPSCRFSGLEPVNHDPHGPMRGTCAIWGRRRRGGCDQRADDTDKPLTLSEISCAKAKAKATGQ